MKIIDSLGPCFQLFSKKENDKFSWGMTEEEMKSIAGEMRIGLNYTIEAVKSGEWDLIIMDEIMAAVNCGYLSLKEVVGLVKIKAD